MPARAVWASLNRLTGADRDEPTVRILHVVSSGYLQGGVETGLVNLNDLLRIRGHEVCTVSSDLRPDLEHFSDVEFRAIPDGGLLAKVGATTFNIDAYRVIARMTSDFEPDIVTLNTLHQASVSALYATRNSKQVLFVQGHEFYTKWLMPYNLGPQDYRTRPYDIEDLTARGRMNFFYLRRVLYPLFMRQVKRVDHVVALSRYMQHMLAAEGIESTHIPMGVRLFDDVRRDGLNGRIGYAGRLESYKGVDKILEAFAIVAKRSPDIEFWIAGGGPHEKYLRERVDALGLVGRVTFHGHLPRALMQEFYASIDVLVMASSTESFGMVGVEAMSTGVPVLAPDIGGIGDWLLDGRNGYFIDPQDLQGTADLLCHLFADPARLLGLGRQATASAAAFDLPTYLDALDAFFDGVAGRAVW